MHRISVRPPSAVCIGAHRGAAAIAGGEAGGLPRQGPTLLLALAALVGIVRRGGQRSGSREAGAGAVTGAAGWSGGSGAATGEAAEQGGRQEQRM